MNIRCSCIRGVYNFLVKSVDKDSFVYHDLSNWMVEDRYEVPETYDVVVTPPGKSEGISLVFYTEGINRVTSDDVGCIKDGIWTFETVSCDTGYKRSVGIFYKIECCLKKAFATEPKKNYEALKEVEMFLNLSKSSVEIQNFKEASEYLKIAQSKLDIIKCDCNC